MDPAGFRSPEPRITIFHCPECCGELAVAAGHGCRMVECCAGSIDGPRLAAAFLEGADGVLVLGCLGRDCCVKQGDIEAFRQIHDGARALQRLGVAPARLQRVWLTRRESARIPALILSFRRRLHVLGPRFAPRPEPVGTGAAMSAHGA